jgi:flagellar hook assembly protein FlgD
MPFEDSVMACEGDMSIDLDNNDEPHMAYFCESYFGRGIKYAKGTFVGIEETSNKMPESRYELEVYPNPFSKLTNIKIQAPSSKSQVTMSIYDVSGRLIRDFLLPTAYSIVPTVISWDGRDYSGHRVPEGIYFIRLSCDSISIIKKVILLR